MSRSRGFGRSEGIPADGKLQHPPNTCLASNVVQGSVLFHILGSKTTVNKRHPFQIGQIRMFRRPVPTVFSQSPTISLRIIKASTVVETTKSSNNVQEGVRRPSHLPIYNAFYLLITTQLHRLLQNQGQIV